MSKKNNFRTISIILGILLVGLAALLIKDKVKGDRSFNKYIVKIDTAEVTGLKISVKKSVSAIEMVKENGLWMLVTDGKHVQADNETIEELMKQLTGLKPKRVAATSKDKWADYEVTDSTGTFITVLNGKKELAKLVLGKFSYSPGRGQNPYQQQSYIMTSYIRKMNENQVYAVDGYLSMMFNRQANSFREDAVVVGKPENWNRIQFQYPADSAFTLEKQDGKWMMNGLMADSLKTQDYFSKIRMLTSQAFDDQTTIESSQVPDFTVVVDQTEGTPIEIKAFTNHLGERVFTSSENKGTVFKAEPVQSVLCVNRNHFLKQ